MSSVDPDFMWPRPPEGGYTAEDLDRLPHLPPHTELIDGSLVFMSPQRNFHSRMMRLLEHRLMEQAPPELNAIREMTVTLGPRNRPEPDVLVVREDSMTGPDQTTFQPEDVILAVEVVSPDSVDRDRGIKPLKYAGAGIAHYWRIENDSGRPVAYIYELDVACEKYTCTGIFHDRLTLKVPFDIEIDFADIDKRRL